MVGFMKHFLPDGTVIPARPSIAANALGHLQWNSMISNYSEVAQKGILEFLERVEIRAQWCTTNVREGEQRPK